MKKIVLNAVGVISLILGIVGIVIPVLPTTPFIVLASICFANNVKMQQFLQKNKYFAEYINNYKTKAGVSVSVKVRSIIFVNFAIVCSQFFVSINWVKILLMVIAFLVSLHIMLLKSKK